MHHSSLIFIFTTSSATPSMPRHLRRHLRRPSPSTPTAGARAPSSPCHTRAAHHAALKAGAVLTAWKSVVLWQIIACTSIVWTH